MNGSHRSNANSQNKIVLFFPFENNCIWKRFSITLNIFHGEIWEWRIGKRKDDGTYNSLKLQCSCAIGLKFKYHAWWCWVNTYKLKNRKTGDRVHIAFLYYITTCTLFSLWRMIFTFFDDNTWTEYTRLLLARGMNETLMSYDISNFLELRLS